MSLFVKISALAFIPVVAFTSPIFAATKEGFTCEKIKDKPTRAACISDREEKAKQKEAEILAQEEAKKLQAIEDEKKRKLVEFVAKSKQELTKNFKDPRSAQFSDLIATYIRDDSYNALCGQVNGKNSYGGYVGDRKFYVRWSFGGDSAMTWIEKSPEPLNSNKAIADAEVELLSSYQKMYKTICEDTKSVKIEQVFY